MYGLQERELRVVADPDAERTARGSTGATGGDSGLRGSWVYQCDSRWCQGRVALPITREAVSVVRERVVCASVSFSRGSCEPGVLRPQLLG